jgi:hypothetical protein
MSRHERDRLFNNFYKWQIQEHEKYPCMRNEKLFWKQKKRYYLFIDFFNDPREKMILLYI